jgi:hypothetical protein
VAYRDFFAVSRFICGFYPFFRGSFAIYSRFHVLFGFSWFLFFLSFCVLFATYLPFNIDLIAVLRFIRITRVLLL